jgi:hypothetical protein
MQVDISASYKLLAQRICGQGPGGSVSRDRAAATTPLARSLMAIKDPVELNSK